jgi:hypothetical protein
LRSFHLKNDNIGDVTGVTPYQDRDINQQCLIFLTFIFAYHLYQKTMVVSLFLFVVFFVDHSYQLNNGVGRIPQMGKIKITISIKR